MYFFLRTRTSSLKLEYSQYKNQIDWVAENIAKIRHQSLRLLCGVQCSVMYVCSRSFAHNGSGVITLNNATLYTLQIAEEAQGSEKQDF